MKNSKFIRFSIGLLLLLAFFTGGQHETHAERPGEGKTITLNIEGIGCITCEWAIEGKLKDLPGVKTADVSSKKTRWWNPFSSREGKAFITYDEETVTVEQLIETIEKSSDAVYTYTAFLLRQ